jgi:hypothetical protein
MRSRHPGHLSVGFGSVGLGAVALAVGMFRGGGLEAPVAGMPLWAFLLTAGAVLSFVGAMVILFAARGEEEVSTMVPAHVAFHSRMSVPEVFPTPLRAGETGGTVAPGARLPAPVAPAQRRVAPVREDMASLEAKIRALTRKINKAGVMLATGQLSREGYLAYVEDLKRQRATIEAQKVRIELKG